MPGPDLTPTQDLVMEVLAARTRLGERLWTFESRHIKAAEGLEAKGLVTTMHGIVEKTFRASLTPAGRELYIDAEYIPPILQGKKKGKKNAW